MLFEPRAEVILDAVAGHDLRADHLELFGLRARPVQSGRDQDQRASRGMPASRKTSSIGRRIVWLGTGRVMSQIRMQASLRPCASSRKPGVPIGSSSADRDGALRDRERRDVLDRQRADHAIRREFHVQSRSAVVERDTFMMSIVPEAFRRIVRQIAVLADRIRMLR